MSEQKKSGFATLIGRPNVGKVHADESDHRPEDRYYFQSSADYQKPIQTVYTCDRRTDRVSGYTRYSQGKKQVG